MDEIGRNENPEYDELLTERSQGFFDGMLKKEMDEKCAEEYAKSRSHPWSYVAEGYENYKIIFLKLLNFIEKYGKEEKLIIVAHAGIDNVLMYLLKRKKEIADWRKWINDLPDEEGDRIILEDVKTANFDQNYFYSWDGEKLEKI